jgi:hypothetical protein
MGVHETKVFRHGDAIGVELPAGHGFEPGEAVRVEAVAGELRIVRIGGADDVRSRMARLAADLLSLPPVPETERGRFERIEFPAPPGLED